MRSVIAILLLFIISTQGQEGGEGGQDCTTGDKRHVVVYNKLSSDSAPLKVHCFSGNNELGYHMLKKDEFFKFGFCLNFFPNTKFFCHVWWGNKNKGFVAFKQVPIKNFLADIWVAKDDGIYLTHYEDLRLQTKMYDWE